jgi:hypothetical protein
VAVAEAADIFVLRDLEVAEPVAIERAIPM